MSDSTNSADLRPKHFGWSVDESIATITLDRPDRKNALTFETYRELITTFRALQSMDGVKAVVLTGAGGNFSSGGDVHEIIGPLIDLRDDGDLEGLLSFTRMTGSLVAAMRDCPQPIVAAIDGVCTGAGAMLAMASDLRYGTPDSRVAFLFVRVGLSGADMGACSILPRIIGYGRATELLYTGRFMNADEAERWGFYNRIVDAGALLRESHAMAHTLATGPTFAHALTKRCLHHEWSMPIDDALQLEAEAQALCMQSEDFARAYRAFVAKSTPIFEGD
ncbi:MAG TPA: enoyl-CoA hydratase family protein [Gemmatimonadaceae bacterium]